MHIYIYIWVSFFLVLGLLFMLIMVNLRSHDSGLMPLSEVDRGPRSNLNLTDLITIILMTLFHMIVV